METTLQSSFAFLSAANSRPNAPPSQGGSDSAEKNDFESFLREHSETKSSSAIRDKTDTSETADAAACSDSASAKPEDGKTTEPSDSWNDRSDKQSKAAPDAETPMPLLQSPPTLATTGTGRSAERLDPANQIAARHEDDGCAPTPDSTLPLVAPGSGGTTRGADGSVRGTKAPKEEIDRGSLETSPAKFLAGTASQDAAPGGLTVPESVSGAGSVDASAGETVAAGESAAAPVKDMPVAAPDQQIDGASDASARAAKAAGEMPQADARHGSAAVFENSPAPNSDAEPSNATESGAIPSLRAAGRSSTSGHAAPTLGGQRATSAESETAFQAQQRDARGAAIAAGTDQGMVSELAELIQQISDADLSGVFEQEASSERSQGLSGDILIDSGMRHGLVSSPTSRALTPVEAMRAAAPQIVATLQTQNDGGMEMRLNPVELGHLRISFTQTDSGLAVTVHAERSDTLEMVRRNADVLAAELQSAGYDQVTLDFGSENRETAGGNDRGGNATNSNATIVVSEVAPQPQHAPSPLATGSLDIRL